MIILIILTSTSYVVSMFSLITKLEIPTIEKALKKVSIISLLASIACIILMFFNLRLKGAYTTSIIGSTFILSTILLFGVSNNSRIRMFCGMLTVPIGIIGILSLIWNSFSAFFLILFLLFKHLW